jgi:hypothetical protein
MPARVWMVSCPSPEGARPLPRQNPISIMRKLKPGGGGRQVLEDPHRLACPDGRSLPAGAPAGAGGAILWIHFNVVDPEIFSPG